MAVSVPKVRAPAENVRLFTAARREAGALLRLATLLAYDLEKSVPRGIRAGDDVAVLVHGSLATGGAWRPLRKKLEARGTAVVTFTYGPASGVREVAAEIASVLDGVPRGARVHLVGHSLGGLAVRWYVQELPHDPRVVRTISVAAPFDGARGAWFFPGPAGRDMQRGSPALARLVETAGYAGVPHLSIFGTADTAVAPSTAFRVGDRLVVADAGHNTLLFDDAVAGRIVTEISTRN
ncbi:MAG TPA: alpha/beta fold hydrolase [Polyangiaceae bacterium]|jgi:pimeloyl-ACP methyl ester carboxylesterase|nr:alpha/beta fold hydrolase [Polyangiaceae bacterium]